jgi:hypothetical protein
MTKGDYFGLFGVVAALAFQIWVTLRVRRSSQYAPAEKRAQMSLIWLLPIIGAAVSFAMLENENEKHPRDDSSMQG